MSRWEKLKRDPRAAWAAFILIAVLLAVLPFLADTLLSRTWVRIIDVALLFIMLTQIHYLCPLCLATYVVNIVLLVTAVTTLGQSWGTVFRQAWPAAGTFLPGARTPVALGFCGVMMVGALGLLATHLATTYVLEGPPGAMRRQMVDYVRAQKRVVVDTTGDPVEGDSTRPIRVVEFSDFLCPSCQKASKFNPVFLAGHRQELSLVFKNFPLDMECNAGIKRTAHPGACQIAAAGECAQEQGKFWPLHDRIFTDGPKYNVNNLDRDAHASGLEMTAFHECLAGGRGMAAVRRDTAEGQRIEVGSTPTYIINGIRISGALVPATFDELVRASR